MKYRIKQTAKERFIVDKYVKGNWNHVESWVFTDSPLNQFKDKVSYFTLQAAKDWIEGQKVNYPIYHEVK